MDTFSNLLRYVSNTKRREVLRYLVDHGPCRPTDIIDHTDIVQPVVSVALQRGLLSGWLEMEEDGRCRYYSVKNTTLRAILEEEALYDL